MISLVVNVALAVLLVAACLAVGMKLRGVPVRYVDIIVIAALCTGLALLPRVGWALGTLIMFLLVTRAEDVDPWPDMVVLAVAANVVWMFVLGTL